MLPVARNGAPGRSLSRAASVGSAVASRQLVALQASLEKVNRVLLRNHLETCVSEAIRTGQGQEKITELMEALPYNSGLTDFRHQAQALPLDETPATTNGGNGSARGGRRTSR